MHLRIMLASDMAPHDS